MTLIRLAALDSQQPLDGDALIAEVDGVAVAALSLHCGRVLADPFVHTQAVVDLLRVRASPHGRERGVYWVGTERQLPARSGQRPYSELGKFEAAAKVVSACRDRAGPVPRVLDWGDGCSCERERGPRAADRDLSARAARDQRDR